MSSITVQTRAVPSSQKRLIATLWLTYALYYLGRLNVGPALDPLAAALGVSRAAVGVLGTAFFWSYALGQLVSGELGNRYSPRKIVALGLAVVAGVNLLMPGQTTLAVMVALWAVNGLAQSTGWGPLLRILSERLGAEASQRISVFFSMSYQVGAAFSLAFAAWLVSAGGWQAAFFVPGLLLLGVLAFWWFSRLDVPPAQAKLARFHWSDMGGDIRAVWPVLIGAVFMGFVYTAALLWMPSFFDKFGMAAVAGILPLLGAAGMFVAGMLIRRGGAPLKVMRQFLALITICALAAALTSGPAQIAALLVMMLGLGGSVALLLASIPMALAPPGRTSSVAALVTAVQNIGGGLAGVLVGAMVDSTGWPSVFLVWAGCGLVSLGISILLRKMGG